MDHQFGLRQRRVLEHGCAILNCIAVTDSCDTFIVVTDSCEILKGKYKHMTVKSSRRNELYVPISILAAVHHFEGDAVKLASVLKYAAI